MFVTCACSYVMCVCIYVCMSVCIYISYTTPGVMLKWHLPEAKGTVAVTDCLSTSESYKTLHAPLQQTKSRADDPTVFLLIVRDRV